MHWEITLNPLNSTECNRCVVSIIIHVALCSIVQGAIMQKPMYPKW